MSPRNTCLLALSITLVGISEADWAYAAGPQPARHAASSLRRRLGARSRQAFHRAAIALRSKRRLASVAEPLRLDSEVSGSEPGKALAPSRLRGRKAAEYASTLLYDALKVPVVAQRVSAKRHQRLARDRQAYPEAIAAIDAVCKRDYPGELFPLEQWFMRPTLSSIGQASVKTLIQLSPEARAAALRYVQYRIPTGLELRRQLRLLLFDKRAWDGQVSKWMAHGDYDESILEVLYPVIHAMPLPLKQHLRKHVAELYPKARKHLRRPQTMIAQPEGFGPKRAMDALLRGLLEADQYVLHAVKVNQDAARGYRQYLRKSNELFPGKPQGGYDYEDVMTVARAVQERLRSAIGIPQKERKATLFGSFVAGRAALATSDIDILYNGNPRVDQAIKKSEKTINQRLRARGHHQAKLEPSTLAIYSSEQGGQLNPLELEVTPVAIRLLVYPAFSKSRFGNMKRNLHAGVEDAPSDHGVEGKAFTLE